MGSLCKPVWTKWIFLGCFVLLTNTANSQRVNMLLHAYLDIAPIHTAKIFVKEVLRDKNHAFVELFANDIKEEVSFDEKISYIDESGIMILQIPPGQQGQFRLRISSRSLENIRVRIINMKGKLIKRLGIKRGCDIYFDNDLNPGNYIIEAVQGNSRRIQKLIRK